MPFLPVLRYTESGLRKRAQWERTWELQRQEDAIDARTRAARGRSEPADADRRRRRCKTKRGRRHPGAAQVQVGRLPEDDYWRLRGRLDVPKERFISYPCCERDADPSLVVAWAGWDHLQQAHALAAYYVERKDPEGWPPERLMPLLAGLLELLPWLHQWHNDLRPGARRAHGRLLRRLRATTRRARSV